jgi:hypothetical protein
MAQRTKSRSAVREIRRSTPNDVVPTVELQGDPTGARARIVVVPKTDRVLKKLRWQLKIRGSRNEKVLEAKRPAISRDAFQSDAKSLAILEGVRIAQADLRQAGGAYDLQQVRTLMHGVSRRAIDKRVQEGSLLAVPGHRNRRSYPTLQFDQDGTVVAGLKAVRDALPTNNPWAILNFLAQPDDRLRKRRPIDVLKEGHVDLVVEAARRVGKQGA